MDANGRPRHGSRKLPAEILVFTPALDWKSPTGSVATRSSRVATDTTPQHRPLYERRITTARLHDPETLAAYRLDFVG